jgi:hypothetical protein
MGKLKNSVTGKGYLGEIMVHKVSGQAGIVENVIEARAGWAPEITVKLADGSIRKGKLSDFKEATREQRKAFPAKADEDGGETAQDGLSG